MSNLGTIHQCERCVFVYTIYLQETKNNLPTSCINYLRKQLLMSNLVVYLVFMNIKRTKRCLNFYVKDAHFFLCSV